MTDCSRARGALSGPISPTLTKSTGRNVGPEKPGLETPRLTCGWDAQNVPAVLASESKWMGTQGKVREFPRAGRGLVLCFCTFLQLSCGQFKKRSLFKGPFCSVYLSFECPRNRVTFLMRPMTHTTVKGTTISTYRTVFRWMLTVFRIYKEQQYLQLKIIQSRLTEQRTCNWNP